MSAPQLPGRVQAMSARQLRIMCLGRVLVLVLLGLELLQ
jgi:hypothetical protein